MDDDCTLDYYIQKDCKPNEADDAKSISILDIVRMELKKVCKPQETREIPLLPMPKVYEGPSIAWYKDQALKQFLEGGGGMQSACTISLQEICPCPMWIKLMQEVCAEHSLEAPTIAAAPNHLPPLPPKKQKRVTFNLEPTTATAINPVSRTSQTTSAHKKRASSEPTSGNRNEK